MIGQALKSFKIENVPVLAPRQRAIQAREMSQLDVDYDIILRDDQVHMDNHWNFQPERQPPEPITKRLITLISHFIPRNFNFDTPQFWVSWNTCKTLRLQGIKYLSYLLHFTLNNEKILTRKNKPEHDQMVKTISLTLSTVLAIVRIPMSIKTRQTYVHTLLVENRFLRHSRMLILRTNAIFNFPNEFFFEEPFDTMTKLVYTCIFRE